jgi:hypothetical protein
MIQGQSLFDLIKNFPLHLRFQSEIVWMTQRQLHDFLRMKDLDILIHAARVPADVQGGGYRLYRKQSLGGTSCVEYDLDAKIAQPAMWIASSRKRPAHSKKGKDV